MTSSLENISPWNAQKVKPKKWVNARSDKYISNRAPCLLINKTAAASNKTKKMRDARKSFTEIHFDTKHIFLIPKTHIS